MRAYNNQNRWQQMRGKKRAHWSILTLDDLPKSNGRYSQLVARYQARYKAAREQGADKPGQKTDDFSG